MLAISVALASIAMAGCSGAGRESAGPAPASASPAPAPFPAPPPAAVPAAEVRSSGAASAARRAPAGDETTELRGEIQRLIGNAACRDDGQCRALPMGSKPCGGPEAYLAWSVVATNGGQLEALAARYREARQARNQRLGLMSDCAVLPEPQVRCLRADAGEGRCTLATSPRMGPTPATR